MMVIGCKSEELRAFVYMCVREREMVKVSEGGEEREMAFLGFKLCKISRDFPGSPVAKTLGS